MRVIKTFFVSILVLLIIAGLSYLAAREILLLMATTRVKQSLKRVRDIDNQQRWAAECSSRGASRLSSGKIHYTQLRYTQLNRYVIEVVCGGMEHNPIVVSEEKLPPLITQQLGQSGLRWGTDSALQFHGLGRTASVSVVEGLISSALGPAEVDRLAGPPTQCVSYGYECCDPFTQQGRSDQIKEALDCPETCYRYCRARPLVLNFSSQPHYDRLTRQLEINSGQNVTFSFTVSPNQEPVLSGYYDEDDQIERMIAMIETVFRKKDTDDELTVVLDYGDGHQDKLRTNRGQFDHVYHCSRTNCEFTANLKVVKQDGAVSVDGLQNQIKILVNN